MLQALLAAFRDEPAPGRARFPRAAEVAASDPAPRQGGGSLDVAGVPMREWLRRLRDDDRAALGALYDALATPLWRVAVLQTGASESAEDVVQDVFLWLWTHRATIAPDTDLRVYLATAVRNRARNLAKHRKVVDTTASSYDGSVGAGLSQPPQLADASLEAAEFLEAYRHALTLLSEREMTAALLRWEESFTFEQIGVVLAVSTKSAQRIVLRVRDKMYEALADFL